MRIGVPRERKTGERRVAITPDGVGELDVRGHKLFVEVGAGLLSGFTDEEYRAAGATLVPELADVWSNADLLVKVKEPAPEEFQYFRPGLAIFSFLHPAADAALTNALVRSGVIGLDYDLVTLEDGRLPILEPMSIIAGKLSIQCGAFALQAAAGGSGVLLGGTPGVKPGKVVVVGAGAAGSNAARVALGMGAEVTVLDVNMARLQPFAEGNIRARTLYSTPAALERELTDADLVIGSVLIPGALAPKLLKQSSLKEMKKGSVIVDICIDQGGFAELSRATSIAEPTYFEEGVVHYCVPNMPALVPRTSTQALTIATLRWIKRLSDHGILSALRESEPLLKSVVSYERNLTNHEIGEAVGLKSISIDALRGML